MLPNNPHFPPRLPHHPRRLPPKQLLRHIHRRVRKLHKRTIRRNPIRRHRRPPHLPRLLPTHAPKRNCTLRKRTVRDSREDMHAAAVALDGGAVGGGEGGNVGVVGGLGVFAEAGIVVGGAGVFHVAECDAGDAGEEAAFADEPVCVCGLR